jgi:hypothetical protein
MNLSSINAPVPAAITPMEQRAEWAEGMAAKVGVSAWRTVETAWQEQHCDVLAALAEALDQIWLIVRAGGSFAYRVIVRLDSFPEIVNALTTEIAVRSITLRGGPPLGIVADQFRQIGVAICATTGMDACASLGATSERMAVAAAPEELVVTADRELIQSVIDGFDLAPPWDDRVMLLPLAEALEWLVVPSAQPVIHAEQGMDAEHVRPSREAEGRLDLTFERIRASRELDAVTRPLTFGDACE